MNQSGSYSVTKKGSPENQLLLSDLGAKNGVPVAAKSIRQVGEFNNTPEKAPFLDRSAEPVRLTPAWEEDNTLSNDELNFQSLTMEQAALEVNPPKDRLNIVYLILMLHGIGALTPWNMFITAKSYFQEYKLSEDYTGSKQEYATYFMSNIAFASQIPNLLFNWLNIFVQLGGNLTTRVVWSIFVEVVVFVFTVILAMSDTSAYPGAFFWATMTSVVILNIASGIYQNTVYGMGARLPPNYTGAIILGSNISGTFTAIISLVALYVSPSHRTAAIYYFITALFVLLACFDTYFALPLIRFYRYNEYMSEKKRTNSKRRVPYCTILKDAGVQLYNVFFTFFVTLAIFPAVHSDITSKDEDFVIPKKYYVSIMCFITFNVTAMLGSFLTSFIKWPSPKYLWIFVTLRVLFIPFFVLCNYVPGGDEANRTLPVLIDNDWVYLTGAILMGLSSGYCSSLAMMYVPGTVDPSYAATAGMFGGAVLITGIVCGIFFSFVFPWFVDSFWQQLLNTFFSKE